MKNIKSTLLTIGLAASTTLLLAGCSEGDHAGHDHDNGHGDHAHAEGDGHDHADESHADGEGSDDVAAVAGKIAETTGAMAVVEKPTEEQLKGTKEYTLKTCLVSGEELGSMGEPLLMLVGDQQVKLCCDHCVPDFKKDTAKIMAKLNQ